MPARSVPPGASSWVTVCGGDWAATHVIAASIPMIVEPIRNIVAPFARPWRGQLGHLRRGVFQYAPPFYIRDRRGAEEDTVANWFASMDGRERRTFWACFTGWALDAMDVQ